MRRTLMKDLAAAAGVSVSQVSRALAGKPDVAPELRRRILELAREKNYRNCTAVHRRTVAVLAGRMDKFSSSLVNELLAVARQKGWRMVIVPHEHLEFLDDRLFDGAIGLAASELSRTWHERHRIPLVVINSYGWMLDRVCSVFPDSNGESRLAMEHLISLGHRKIARLRLIGENASEQETNRGYDEFLRVASEYGIRDSVRYCHAPDWERLELRIRELVGEGFTGFIAIFIDGAPKVIDAIRNCGKRIPEDISLVAYESAEMTAHLTPPLTALAYDYRGLAAAAAGRLELELEGCGKQRPNVGPGRRIVRPSTAPPPRFYAGEGGRGREL